MVLVKRRVAIKASADQNATAHNVLVDYFNSPDVVLAGVTFTAPALLADGTAAAPGLAFAADPDTGIWRNAANQGSLTAGGTTALVWMASGIQTINATVLQGLNVGTATGAATGDVRASGNLFLAGLAVAGGAAAAASLHAVVVLQRNSVNYGFLGLDALDRLAVLNATPVSVAHVESAFFLPTVPCARVTSSGTSVAPSTTVALRMDAASFDTDTMYDAGNHRLKATRPGTYQISATAEYPGAAGGSYRWSRVRLNGATVLTQATTTDPAGTVGAVDVYHSMAALVTLAVNDFVTVDVLHDNGAALTVTGNLSMHFVSN